MKQKFLSLMVYNHGDVVDVLCKCPATPEQIMSALSFLDEGMQVQVSIVDKSVVESSPAD